MSDGFTPFFIDYEGNGSVNPPKGRYLVVGVVAPASAAPTAWFVAANQAEDGKIYNLSTDYTKFRGFIKSCLMCQWPRAEGEKA